MLVWLGDDWVNFKKLVFWVKIIWFLDLVNCNCFWLEIFSRLVFGVVVILRLWWCKLRVML